MANKALSFGGDTSYVACGTADPGTTFTIGGWIKWGGTPNTADDNHALITKLTAWGNMRWWFGIKKDDSKLLIWGDGAGFPYWSYVVPSDGTAVHIVWVHDTTAGDEKLYVNGAYHSTITAIALGAQTGTPISLGAATGGGSEKFKGDMDGWFINTTILDATTIDNIYDGTDPNSVTGAWATWHMDEGTGTATDDVTGSNDGTLSGATLPTWIDGFEAVASVFTPRLMLLGVG